MKKLIVLAVVILGFTATSFAQLSATASITANILPVISIQKINDLNFGNIYTPSAAGTVEVLAQETPNRKALPTEMILGSGSGEAAKFTLTGVGSGIANHLVSFPNTPITLSSGSNTMNVVLTAYTAGGTVPAGTITIDPSGLATFYIGGTLHINANQPFGSYKNTTDFIVTVNN